jgi:hypothetical protein
LFSNNIKMKQAPLGEGESVADGVRRLTRHATADESRLELETLRSRFEAARASYGSETAQLREELASARSLAQAARSQKTTTRQLEEALEASKRQIEDLQKARQEAELCLERERAASCDATERDEASRRALRDARFDADASRGAARVAHQRLAALESETSLAKTDAANASKARANLEDVLRSVQTRQNDALAAQSEKHADE